MPENHVKFHSSSGKRRILVVEDELINQQILEMMLKDTYDLLFAATGKEALDMVGRYSETISLILLDLNLPDIHGLEVLQQLKVSESHSRIPIIVMTAEKDAEVESLNIGAIDFIPKPYPQPKVVLARILRTIELSEDRDIIRWTERDQLTGLYNREYFYRYAAQYDSYHKDIPTDALVFDINHFHMINERYGKPFGDQILTQIGEILRETVAESGGIVCRKEADTFLVYCPHREDYAELLDRASIELGRNNRLRLRMGVYPNVDKELDIERRFDRAKSAADTVRNNFTKMIAFYDNSLHESEIFADQLLEDFHTALEEKQFLVYFQPKFDIRPAIPVLHSAEALVRWQHPTLGMISPGIFIPLFENNGLILELDHYVWREAALQIRRWKDELGVSLPVSVNISRVDMYDPDLVDHLDRIIQETGLEYKDLLLEITESAYTQDSEQMIAKVHTLREKSFLVEMDDFGSGYSSLNMLSSLPIDALKLDMQFIRTAFKDRKDTRLLEVIIALAETLEVPTIAEGVETAEQLFTLKTMGCDYVQGYYFSRPLPADEFEAYIQKQNQEYAELMEKEGTPAERDKFTYDALHDPLTGMYNHSAFDILFHDSDKDHIAVMIADIDDYIKLKTTHGRAVTDQAVKRVAEVLRDNFRNVDDICRLKEDEFVVIMTRVTRSMQGLVLDKVEKINEILRQSAAEGLPVVSLSVGVAFSDRENPEGDIFQDADTALYRMKQVKNCGCAVY